MHFHQAIGSTEQRAPQKHRNCEILRRSATHVNAEPCKTVLSECQLDLVPKTDKNREISRSKNQSLDLLNGDHDRRNTSSALEDPARLRDYLLRLGLHVLCHSSGRERSFAVSLCGDPV